VQRGQDRDPISPVHLGKNIHDAARRGRVE
jgi:hypothetical protein